MNAQRGYTVIELLVASAIMLVVLGAVTEVLHDGILRAPVLAEASDLQQRTRVVAELLAAELRRAGAGDDARALAGHIPGVLPRSGLAPPTVALPSVLTVRYTPDGGGVGRLAAPFVPGDSVLVLDAGGPCVAAAIACGFTTGATVVVLDDAGNADMLTVTGIGPGALSVVTHVAPAASSYGVGSSVLEVIELTLAMDPVARTLMRDQNGTSLPIADNVLSLDAQYLGVQNRPLMPRPPVGIANCLYAADGTYLHAGLLGAPPDLYPLALADFTDGPFCGAGRFSYDVDLLRVRAVRISTRLDAATDALRGTDTRFFARPGQARSSRVLPDMVATFTVSLRNHGR